MTRVVVDPVTRIEGHLRIEAVIENGVITDAYSAGTMIRGLEKILIGRDPRDAWAITERVCGVCTTVHALASVRAVEDAIGVAVPPTAELIRNIMMATLYVQDHVVHFYHLHALDWVDIVNALKAGGVVAGAQKSLLDAMPRIRNMAMHAEWSKISEPDVSSVLGFVEQLLLSKFSEG